MQIQIYHLNFFTQQIVNETFCRQAEGEQTSRYAAYSARKEAQKLSWGVRPTRASEGNCVFYLISKWQNDKYFASRNSSLVFFFPNWNISLFKVWNIYDICLDEIGQKLGAQRYLEQSKVKTEKEQKELFKMTKFKNVKARVAFPSARKN